MVVRWVSRTSNAHPIDSGKLTVTACVRFMIGGLAMIMPLGKLYSLFDAKQVYIASFVLFLASSALCGGAPNMNAEIVGRVFAGAGGNGMYLGLLTLISVNTTDKERPAWLSLRRVFNSARCGYGGS